MSGGVNSSSEGQFWVLNNGTPTSSETSLDLSIEKYHDKLDSWPAQRRTAAFVVDSNWHAACSPRPQA